MASSSAANSIEASPGLVSWAMSSAPVGRNGSTRFLPPAIGDVKKPPPLNGGGGCGECTNGGD